MSFARPIRIPLKLIPVSDSQNSAVAATIRQGSQQVHRPSPTLRAALSAEDEWPNQQVRIWQDAADTRQLAEVLVGE